MLYALLSRTKENSTICPSQIPRQLAKEGRVGEWRSLMPSVREAVWAEAKKGIVEVTQGGEVRKWEEREELVGPIRVRRGPKWSERVEPVGKGQGAGEHTQK